MIEITPPSPALKNYKTIPLTRGFEAIVDNADYDMLMTRKWHAKVKNGRVKAAACTKQINCRKTSLYMHRVIVSCPNGWQVDHINHNPLDNRRSNLRICTPSQNSMNTRKHKNLLSKYKCVRYVPKLNRWSARIQKNGTRYIIGNYLTEEDAALAYNIAAQLLFGEFAHLNTLL